MQRLVSSCRALTSLPYRHTVPLRLPCRPLSTSTGASSNTNEHTASTLSSASHPPTAAASSAGATTPSQPAAATTTTTAATAATAPPNVNSPEEEEMRLNFLRLSQLMNGAVIEQPTPGITAEAQVRAWCSHQTRSQCMLACRVVPTCYRHGHSLCLTNHRNQ